MREVSGFLCAKNNCFRQRKAYRDFCSSHCADESLPSTTESTKKPGRSTSTAPGEALRQQYEDEKRIAKEPSESARFVPKEPESAGQQQPPTIVDEPPSDTETNDSPELSTTEHLTFAESMPATQSSASEKPSPISELVGSESANLIDDSVRHLHGLMKSVRSNLESNARLDPHAINAACNCAKQMGNLLKLKLDAVKTRKAIR